MKSKLIILASIALALLQGCAYPIRYDGTYMGRVVNADTGQPIEGAVVLGTWSTVMATVAGGVHSFYDARETATDKSGKFSISGMGLRIMSNLEPMHFIIFKSGYEHLGSMPWASLKMDALLSKKIKWEEDVAIIPLKKLTIEERRNRLGSYYVVGAPSEKQKLLQNEVEKENVEIGK